MGLDSVELIYEVEGYFQVAISDHLAETISTVGDFAAAVTRLQNLPPNAGRTAVHAEQLAKMMRFLRRQFPDITAATPLQEIGLLRPDEMVRPQLADHLSLILPSVPTMVGPASAGWLQRLFGLNYPPPVPPAWPRATLAEFCDWLLAQNYQQLLPVPATLYEVQQAIIGLTSEKCGINVAEIQLTDSFTSDLGID
ncbi:hypothetical protein J7E24_06495 [Hymenobacter sp. ISL-91]|uniref:hypothetical protein n=1 Tax=Hymenobacter sp. ISL-91 TaxID=2819151 RepID=UPI001BE8FF23|nr:hypothetical protein [Hymenobacter sp. ISL-91]MBT2557428.1 hypothetical protein [Hymenobacter sp. ISL-91]